MKKNILFLVFGFMTLFSYSQIGLVENFDAGLTLPAGWTSDAGDYFGTVIEVCDGFSQRSNFSSSNPTGHLTSLNIAGQSNGTDLTIAFDYKIVDWSAGTNPTPAGWGELLVQFSTNDGGVWTTVETINDGNHDINNVCTNVSFVVDAASLPVGSNFKLRLESNWLVGDYYTYIDNVSATQVVVDPPSCVNLLIPTNGQSGVSINSDLSWTAASGIPTGTIVSVGTTSGGTDVIDNQSVGLSTSLDLPTLEYSTVYFVNITPFNANGDAEGCVEFTFTTGADPNAPVDCGTGIPVNTVYCYTNNETMTWNFQSSDGSPLNVFFNAGQMEGGNFDQITIYDGIDNTGILLYDDSNGGDMTGVSRNSPSGNVFIEIDSDGSGSCQANGYIPIDFDVSCIDATAIPNCNASLINPVNGAVDVNENTVLSWSAASIIVTGYTISIGTTPGGTDVVDSFDNGPALTYNPGTLLYETTYYVTIVPYNDNGPATGCNEESFTTRNDPNQIVDCSIGEVINTVYCYTNNDTMQFNFASSDGSPLVVIFNSGTTENGWDELIVLDSDGVTDLNAATPYGNNGDLTGLMYVSSGSTLTIGVTSDGSVVSCTGDPWNFDVSCVDTTQLPNCNASLTSPVNGAIDINENDDINWSPASIFVTGYTISIGTTPGGTDVADNVDVGNVLTYDPGTLDYATTYYVTIIPYNNNGPATGCTEESFTTRNDPNQIVDCASGLPVNTVYCYENNDTMQFNFASSDGSPLVVIFNSGTTENGWDELIVLDSDGVTDLNAATPYGNNGDLTGLMYVSSGSTLTIGVTSDGIIVSCTNDPWDFDVFCVDTTALPNCDSVLTAPLNGEIDVHENDDDIFWSAATIFVTGYTISIGTTSGGTDVVDNLDVGNVQTYDPGTLDYATTYYVTIIPYNDNGPATGCIEESFTVRDDPFVIVDCDAGSVNTTYCYTNNDTMEFYFTSSTGFPLNILFNAGQVENTWDEVIILDSDGVTDLNAATPYGNNGDLTGVGYTSTGDSLTIIIQSDGIGSCDTSGYIPWDFDVWCQTCLIQSVDFNIVGDCDTEPDNPSFMVDVEITDLGDAASVTITDDQGSAAQVTSELGIITFGPYPANAEVIVTVANTDDANCIVNSDSLTFICPPPPNPCSIIYAGENTSVDCTSPSTDLTAVFHLFGQDTNVYEINALDNCPQPPTTGGEPTSLTIDDRWSEVIDLEFEFCFFGETYSQIVIGSNGVLTFDLTNANGGNGWAFTESLPNNTNATLAEANIFGVAHDIDPGVCGDINYIILGSSPSRQFVVNYTNVCHFSCNDIMSSSQIILYESSNAIDVNIFDKPTCTTWNSGNAVVGVQNPAGTIAFTPPGRNTGPWTATDEFWRFSPAVGTPNYSFEWFDGATSIGTTETITVSPTEPTVYTASITYELCIGGTATITDNVFVDYTGGEPTIVEPQDMIVCDDDADGFASFMLTDQDAVILDGQTGLTVSYHLTQIDSETGNAPIASPYTNVTNPQIIYVRIEDDVTACVKLTTFNLIVSSLPTANQPPDLIDCDDDGDGFVEFDLSVQDDIIIGAQIDVLVTYHVSQGDADNAIGVLPSFYTNTSNPETIYVRVEDTLTGCFSTITFNLIIGDDPDTSFDSNVVYEICPNATTPINVTAMANNYSTSEVDIVWYQDGGEITGENGLSIPVLVAGTYEIEVTFITTGCTSIVSVEVYELDNCIIPQVITPNGDNFNDNFDLSSWDVQSLEIFNRYGVKVYTKNNYTNDWFGQSDDGDELPVGTYFYVMKYQAGKVKTSWVYIEK